MKRRVRLFAVLFMVGGTAAASVSITRSVARMHDDTAMHQVTFSYDFPGRDSVVITGIGVVAGKGEVRNYLTRAAAVDFRDAVTGEKLEQKEIVDTVVTMGGGGADLPSENDFPSAYRTGLVANEVFATRVVEVIQRFFPSGFTAAEVDDVHHYTSAYRSLDVKKAPVRAEVAVLVTQPYAEGAARRFRVQYIVRDRPRLSTKWRYGDERAPETLAASQAFVDQIVSDLQKATK